MCPFSKIEKVVNHSTIMGYCSPKDICHLGLSAVLRIRIPMFCVIPPDPDLNFFPAMRFQIWAYSFKKFKISKQVR